MKEEKKPTPPKFNIYWIYGAVIFVLLGLSLFGGNDWQTMQKTNISNFEQFLNAGDVSEVIVIRNKSSVLVTLTPEALNKTEHQNAKSKNILGQENSQGPHYQFEVGSLELFEEKLEKARSEGIPFRLEFITIENRWLDTLIGFLPIIIIIGVYVSHGAIRVSSNFACSSFWGVESYDKWQTLRQCFRAFCCIVCCVVCVLRCMCVVLYVCVNDACVCVSCPKKECLRVR